jgi:hypothetical protein
VPSLTEELLLLANNCYLVSTFCLIKGIINPGSYLLTTGIYKDIVEVSLFTYIYDLV